MNTTPNNEMMGLPCADAPATTTEPTPTPAERNATAASARDRLRTATKEAFPRSQQYRPAQDGTSHVGNDAK